MVGDSMDKMQLFFDHAIGIFENKHDHANDHDDDDDDDDDNGVVAWWLWNGYVGKLQTYFRTEEIQRLTPRQGPRKVL